MCKKFGMGSIWFASLALVVAFASCSKADDKPAAPTTQASAYPLTTCPVSGEKLGAMGDPVIISYQGREVRFCCSNCEAEFKKDPAKYVAMLDDAGKSGDKPATQPAEHAH